MNICDYCRHIFSTNQSLKRHYLNCKERQKQINEKRLTERYENHIQSLQKQLSEQQFKYEKQIEKLELQNKELQMQIFEIAKQPKTTTVTNNNTTQTRNTNIINQLALYDLNQEQITQLLTQHYNVETFYGGPEEIAKFAVQFLLTDPHTKKAKITCTDINRKNFKYVDNEQEVQVDPGFQKTHDLIKEPLSKANIRVYVDDLKQDDKYHDQWRKNEDFISDRSEFSDKLIKWMV
ncbi:hypothetical protein EBU71_19045 [bacterium]|nr:hypothetical protein [Candidatus Elulimicrobium humile]